VVTKEIKNAARRHDNTRVKRVEDDDTFGIDTASLSTLTEVEAKSLREGFLRFLRKVATKDVEELDFVKSCQEDGYTRQEIADLMSVAPEKITNLQKRVCRRWAEYVDQEWPGHQETLS
jgi:DNA-directed RNA polymerase specialized sigma24 family protein